MPDAPELPADLIALQAAVLRAQQARHAAAATGSQPALAAAMETERQAVVALYRHPGKIASQAGGKWQELVAAAEKVIAEEHEEAPTAGPETSSGG